MCLPRDCAPAMRLMVVLAISVDACWPRGLSDCRITTLPCPACVSNLGWSRANVRLCKSKKRLHSVILRILAAIYRTPLGADIDWCMSGKSSSSIVEGRSSMTDAGSPAENMVFPRGAKILAVCISADVKDCCSCFAAVWAWHTLIAHCLESLLASGLWRVIAISRFVLPPIAVRRC